MQQGTVARLMDKGYGFIKPNEGGKDLFFHMNELQNAKFDDLKEGEAVEYELGEGPKGPQAVKVSRLG